MDRVRKALGMSSKKRIKNQASSHQEAIHTRSPNWGVQETHVLLHAAREVQLNSGRTDLNFTTTQWNKIYEIFKRKDTNSRILVQLQNRIKTLKREFTNFRELANKSGWGWDPENHVPVPPDENTWAELLNVSNYS